MDHLSHLSFRGEPWWPLAQFQKSPIHYLAYDISPWIASAAMLPIAFRQIIPDTFSGLRILRLVGYWVLCETPSTLADPLQLQPPAPTNPLNPTANEQNPLEEEQYLGIGRFIDVEQSNSPTSSESTLSTVPTLYIEAGFLDMLSHIPSLQALEVGGIAVRDAGRLRTQVGHAKQWLSQRTRWEDEFVHRIASHAAKGLVVVSFLACDEPTYRSAFTQAPSRRQWSSYLQGVKRQIVRDNELLGNLSELIARAGLARWSGSTSEPNKCDYWLNSAFVPSMVSRQLFEEVVTNEWVKVGESGTWTKRINVRNLRDIWPAEC
jgi:hypothetical protein